MRARASRPTVLTHTARPRLSEVPYFPTLVSWHSQHGAPDEKRDVFVKLDEYPDLIVRVQEPSPLEKTRERLGGTPAGETKTHGARTTLKRTAQSTRSSREQY